MRGVHVRISDDSAGWLFYFSDLKKTYISMDVSFDEGFTSPMILPDLPFNAAIRLRNITPGKSYKTSSFQKSYINGF